MVIRVSQETLLVVFEPILPARLALMVVLEALPALRDALAKIVSAFCAACRDGAWDKILSGGAHEALRAAAAALEQSMGREHGFWRDDAYALSCVMQLVASEAELELLLTRLLQLLRSSPRQCHVSPRPHSAGSAT